MKRRFRVVEFHGAYWVETYSEPIFGLGLFAFWHRLLPPRWDQQFASATAATAYMNAIIDGPKVIAERTDFGLNPAPAAERRQLATPPRSRTPR